MEKCKYCEAELPEGSTVCPNCGKDNAAEAVPVEETAAETAPVEDSLPEEQTEEAPAAVPAGEGTPEPQAAEEPLSAEIQEGVKATPGKIAVAVAAVVVLAAVLIALLVAGFSGKSEEKAPTETSAPTAETTVPEETVPATVPADGNPDDETCKGTYTASDAEVIAAADTVVATAGDFQLTNSQLQVYYWLEVQSFLNNYGYYAYSYGLDYTQPLDTQVCFLTESGTWQQFFLATALNSWHSYTSLAHQAELEGFTLDDDTRAYLDGLPESLETQAAEYGFDSVDALLAYNVGSGASLQDYLNFMESYYLGYQYFEDFYDEIQPTDEEVEAYFTENEAAYAENGLTRDENYVNVRHILVLPEGATTDTIRTETFSDEAWAVGEANAQAILDEWLAGEKTEESFGALANEKSQDPGSNTAGGLYTDVEVGQMVEEFEAWCFDEARQPGDYGIVRTSLGYHVMYFVDSEPVWPSYARSDLINDTANGRVAEITAQYPLKVDYSSILLGFVDMS